jgi:hypothetical protein
VCVSKTPATLLVSVHVPLDVATTQVLAETLEAAVHDTGDPRRITMDMRRAGPCSSVGLRLVARSLERGVSLRADAADWGAADRRDDDLRSTAEGARG